MAAEIALSAVSTGMGAAFTLPGFEDRQHAAEGVPAGAVSHGAQISQCRFDFIAAAAVENGIQSPVNWSERLAVASGR